MQTRGCEAARRTSCPCAPRTNRHQAPLSRRRALGVRPRLARPARRARAARARSRSRSATTLPELLARILAGRGVEVDDVASFLDPTVRSLDARPDTLAGMAAAAARLADAVSAAKSRDLRRLRRRRRDRRRRRSARFLRHGGLIPIVHIPDRIFEGYGPNVEAIRTLAGTRRKTARHRRLRHHQPRAARRGAQARPRRDRHRSSPRRRDAAAGTGGGQSEPARRSLRARPSRRGRAGVHDRGRGQPRAAATRLLDWRRGRSPIFSACSIWSRSAPSPTWCRSRASTAPSSPRGCWRCAGARTSASPR